MVYQDQNVLLMRDMTDAMYNPAKRPQVSHFRGTELVIEHIEKHWCPTITSADVLTDKEPFVFSILTASSDGSTRRLSGPVLWFSSSRRTPSVPKQNRSFCAYLFTYLVSGSNGRRDLSWRNGHLGKEDTPRFTVKCLGKT